MKEHFFVGIKDPLRTRRDLLSSSKVILDSLKKYDDFVSAREEKQKYIFELKRVIDELMVLNKKLRAHLPKTPLKVPELEMQKVKVKGKKAKTVKAETTAKSKLDLLEQELSKVESRLKALE
ncbi:MAG: hypothetical protein QW666_01580 [Candidatus Woesearchaeota archaeon]